VLAAGCFLSSSKSFPSLVVVLKPPEVSLHHPLELRPGWRPVESLRSCCLGHAYELLVLLLHSMLEF